MTVTKLVENLGFSVLWKGDMGDEKIIRPYCCDLLSIAMGKLPANSAWVTVMGNINTVAVAVLTECACIILAEGAAADEAMLSKVRQQGITLMATDLTVFDAALKIHELIKDEDT